MKSKLAKLIPQALKNIWHLFNAVAAVIINGFPGRKLNIIGVTGTDGKTTTSTLTYHLLKQSGIQVALISTVAAYIDKEEIDTGFHVTSPSPWQLQALLKRIAKLGVETVVLESTSHGLDQHRFFGVNFSLGILTNLTHEHLDYHKTMDRYAKAKAKLFSTAKVAILNKTDSSYKLIKPHINPDIRIIPYGQDKESSLIERAINKRFPESYNRLNAKAAVAVARYYGANDKQISQALVNFPGIKGRMEEIPNKLKFKTIVDFAHTPNALEQALTSLKPRTKGRLIAVYGSAGLRDREKRKMMGQIGARLADEVVLTAEDPRTESVWAIIDEMASRIKTNIGHIHKIPDRQQAIDFAISLAKPGDTVVVLGKGHETSMCYGTIEHPWSDQTAIKKALKKYE